MVDNMDVAGKTALVSGAAQGIGKSIALRLGRLKANVIVNYLKSRESAESVVESLRAFGVESDFFKADVTNYNQVKNLIQFGVKKFGGVDILVNNAGKYTREEIEKSNVIYWHHCIRINLVSVMLMTKMVLPFMRQNRYGRIVNMSSVTGIRGSIAAPCYAAAKAGIIGFTKSIARKYGKYNILSNAIAPGVIDTDSTRSWMTEGKKAKIISETPVGRLGTAEDVADAVEFLVRTDFINGTVLVVGGGRI
jgi:3-oxoacyl-[acyl-carrier protein] reductase